VRTTPLRRGGASNFRRVVARLAASGTAIVLAGILGAYAGPAGATVAAHLSPTARKFVVDTTADGHDAHPGDGVCADTSGKCTLRSAVEAADALEAPVTVIVPAGTYRLSLGPLVVTDPAGLDIVGAGASRTAITAGGASRDLNVKEAGTGKDPLAGAVATLSELTITGGSANAGGDIAVMDANDTLEIEQVSVSGGHATDGGGIATSGQVLISGSSVNGDSATDEGGGIAASDTSLRIADSSLDDDSAQFGGAMRLEDCVTVLESTTLDSDTASSSVADSSGGAIYDSGPMDIVSDRFSSDTAEGLSTESSFGGAVYESKGGVTVTGTTFSNDRSTASSDGDASGGAVFAEGPLTVSGSTFSADATSGKGSDLGGAIYDNSFVSISTSSFDSDRTDGSASSSFGGAFYDGGTGADIVSSTFDGNVALNGNGGAIAASSGGDLLSSDTFSGNDATGGANGEGGALWAESAFTSQSSTFVQNHAQVLGGAIWEDDSSSLVGTTVEENSANQGGGVYVSWVLQATDSAFLDNAATGQESTGGAIMISGTRGGSRVHHIDLQYVTIAGNSADIGAGIADQAGKAQAAGGSIGDSVIASNRTPTGREQDCNIGGGFPAALAWSSGGGNVVGDTTCDLDQATDREGEDEQGYAESGSDGGVFNFATEYLGSMGGRHLDAPVAGAAMRPGNQGYWEVASDGGVFSFGQAAYLGSMGGRHLNAPIVGMSSTPDGMGYWMVASDGGVFSFGDARYFGSMGGRHLNAPIVAMARTPDGRGYWLVASDGGVFSFGDARYFGSTGSFPLNKPVVTLDPAPDGLGYTLFASDGGEFNFGTTYQGNRFVPSSPIVSAVATPDGLGYWEIAADGSVYAIGDAEFEGPSRPLAHGTLVVSGFAT
jgi:CSLREA domain-containing protein